MTTDRKKALFFLGLTLIIGILIGSLLPGFWYHMRKNRWKTQGTEERHDGRPDRRARFQHMIYKVVSADSAQISKIQPVLDDVSTKIEALEKQSNQEMLAIMDTMKLKLRPLLTDDQAKKLEEFSQRNRARRRR